MYLLLHIIDHIKIQNKFQKNGFHFPMQAGTIHACWILWFETSYHRFSYITLSHNTSKPASASPMTLWSGHQWTMLTEEPYVIWQLFHDTMIISKLLIQQKDFCKKSTFFEYCFILQLSAHLLFFFTPQKFHGANQYVNKPLAKGKGN